jgi:hypothetical protein
MEENKKKETMDVNLKICFGIIAGQYTMLNLSKKDISFLGIETFPTSFELLEAAKDFIVRAICDK